MLDSVREIQMQLALELTVRIDDIAADVWPALCILKEEQDRLEKEPRN